MAMLPITPSLINAVERRHEAGIDERIGNFPIGSVPADQEDFFRKRCRHKS